MLEHPKSQWFVIGTSNQDPDRYTGTFQDLGYSCAEINSWWKQNGDFKVEAGFIVWKKDIDDDQLRSDIISIINSNSTRQDSVIVKYHLEPVAYLLKWTGYEEPFGKFIWGAGEEMSYLHNNIPFHFQKVEGYKCDYLTYKNMLVY